MRYFLTDTLDTDRVSLSAEATHHMLRVLRLQRGAEVTLHDGQGTERDGHLVGVENGSALVSFTSAKRTALVLREVHLALGLGKGPAMDDAMRAVTEAGVTHIHPMRCARSHARWFVRPRAGWSVSTWPPR